MNFVLGLFLLVFDHVPSAFYSFNYLAQRDNFLVQGFFEDGFPLLSLY